MIQGNLKERDEGDRGYYSLDTVMRPGGLCDARSGAEASLRRMTTDDADDDEMRGDMMCCCDFKVGL